MGKRGEGVAVGVMGEGQGGRCQAKYSRGECGRPAVWRYRALNLLPHLLCEKCVRRLAAVPWMKARLTRLDAAMGEVRE